MSLGEKVERRLEVAFVLRGRGKRELNVDVVISHDSTDRDTGEVVSREFCGGPHVHSIEDRGGVFRIVREQSISTGVRRIRAVLALH